MRRPWQSVLSTGGRVICGALTLAACARASSENAKASIPSDIVAMLSVENTTPHEVSVYFVDRSTHVRLGTVKPVSESRLPIRRAHLQGRRSFRIYAFRGTEPCPVARVIDLALSLTPRVTVGVSDTIVSAYLPGDGCRGH